MQQASAVVRPVCNREINNTVSGLSDHCVLSVGNATERVSTPMVVAVVTHPRDATTVCASVLH